MGVGFRVGDGFGKLGGRGTPLKRTAPKKSPRGRAGFVRSESRDLPAASFREILDVGSRYPIGVDRHLDVDRQRIVVHPRLAAEADVLIEIGDDGVWVIRREIIQRSRAALIIDARRGTNSAVVGGEVDIEVRVAGAGVGGVKERVKRTGEGDDVVVAGVRGHQSGGVRLVDLLIVRRGRSAQRCRSG